MTQLHTLESNNSNTLRISVILRYGLFWGKEKFHDVTQSNCIIHFNPLKVKREKTDPFPLPCGSYWKQRSRLPSQKQERTARLQILLQ